MEKNVKFHPHAKERMKERGATVEEVQKTIQEGEKFSAKFGRTGFRRNFNFENKWRKKYFKTKQLEVYAAKEGTKWLVITVITRYF